VADLFQHQPDVTLEINGTRHRLSVPASATLLDVLRERLQLYGTKKGCDLGACGACTVLVDGRRANACLMLAAMQDGRRIATIEGVSRDGALHPLQQAFMEGFAAQCGFCTPGMILAAKTLLDRNPDPSRAEVIDAISGNICRCTGYEPIIAAVLMAAEQMRGKKKSA
jgi:aerobic-type carbon monoxide dehydrogenase small subunit (CoxS/CutS family)